MKKRMIILRALAFIVQRLYNIEIDEQSKTNLKKAKECLKNHSMIVYFNHLSLDDSVILLALLINNFYPYINIYAPESRKHFDFRRHPMHALLMRFGSALGLHLYPLVQHYDSASYSRHERHTLLKRFYIEVINALNSDGNILIIAPEGTRSRDKTLQEARRGIEEVGKKTANSTYFLPVGIIPRNKWYTGFNFGRRLSLKVGEPYYNDGNYDINRIMLNLASLLPENMRGIYSSRV
jgi:hypothetical protein